MIKTRYHWIAFVCGGCLAMLVGCSDPAPRVEHKGPGVTIKANSKGTDVTTPAVDVKVKQDGN